ELPPQVIRTATEIHCTPPPPNCVCPKLSLPQTTSPPHYNCPCLAASNRIGQRGWPADATPAPDGALDESSIATRPINRSGPRDRRPVTARNVVPTRISSTSCSFLPLKLPRLIRSNAKLPSNSASTTQDSSVTNDSGLRYTFTRS